MPTQQFSLRKLSIVQRELLIEHLDQGAPVLPQQALTRSTLMKLGLIRSPNPALRNPSYTVLTPKGRHVLAMLLGEYADALVRAGFLEVSQDETPLQVLRRLKIGRGTDLVHDATASANSTGRP